MKNSLKLLLHFAIIFTFGCAAQIHAGKGWDYLDHNDYANAKNEFEKSLQTNDRPGSLSGMIRVHLGLGNYDLAKKYMLRLLEKYPDHRFTPLEIEIWNKRFPDDKVSLTKNE